jgi:Fungal specific transcription factor domain
VPNKAITILTLTGLAIFHPTYHSTAQIMISSSYLLTQKPHIHYIFHRALDLLFKFCTSWCLRIVPALFLRDMFRALGPSQTPPKTSHYSPMLHNALVALALAFADEPWNDIKTRQIYASAAKSFIEDECRKPNLSVVHALSILASYHSSLGDQTLGYMYFGMTSFLIDRMLTFIWFRYECTYKPSS